MGKFHLKAISRGVLAYWLVTIAVAFIGYIGYVLIHGANVQKLMPIHEHYPVALALFSAAGGILVNTVSGYVTALYATRDLRFNLGVVGVIAVCVDLAFFTYLVLAGGEQNWIDWVDTLFIFPSLYLGLLIYDQRHRDKRVSMKKTPVERDGQ